LMPPLSLSFIRFYCALNTGCGGYYYFVHSSGIQLSCQM
jgi:hypothetical protein